MEENKQDSDQQKCFQARDYFSVTNRIATTEES